MKLCSTSEAIQDCCLSFPVAWGVYQLCKFTERHWSVLSDGKLARQTKKLANNCTCTFICHMCPCELKNKVFPAYGGLCLSGTDFHMETVLNWNFGVWMLFCKFKSSPFLPFCIHARFTKSGAIFCFHTWKLLCTPTLICSGLSQVELPLMIIFILNQPDDRFPQLIDELFL